MHDLRGDGLAALDALLVDADSCEHAGAARLTRSRARLGAPGRDTPRLIVVSITPFGLTGRGPTIARPISWDGRQRMLIMMAMTNHSIPPIRPGGDQASTRGGFAQIGALLALLEREHVGSRRRRRRVDARSDGRDRRVANPYWFYPRVLVQRQTCRHAQPSPTQPALFAAPTAGTLLRSHSRRPKAVRSLVEWMDTVGVATDLVDDDYDDLAYRQANLRTSRIWSSVSS